VSDPRLPLLSRQAIAAQLPARSPRHQALREFRVQLLARRGAPVQVAEHWADRLGLRDHHRDDRHLCHECKHLQRGFGCTKRQPVVLYVLMRCAAFIWEKP